MKIFIKGLHSCVMRKQKVRPYKAHLLANGAAKNRINHDHSKGSA